MTSRRKTKKYNAKIVVRLWKDHTPRDVKHYSRGIRRYKKWFRNMTPLLVWEQYMKESKERLDDWQREIMSDSLRCCFDVPELKYSREQTINGTGYGWQNSEGKKPLASCLGISPFLLYGEPTLSSLADDGLSHSSAGIPLEPKKAFDLTHQFIKMIKKQAEDDQ